MANKIIAGLMNGNLASTGKVVFDNKLPCYFVEFQSGNKVGVYARQARSNYFAYTEVIVDDTRIKQSGKPNKDFQIDASINSLFLAIFNSNGKIAELAESQLVTLTEIDPNFVIGLYYYNPKSETPLEVVDMSKWALKDTTKDQLKKANVYFAALNNKQAVTTAIAELNTNLTTFIQNLIVTNQKNGSNAWTANGMLALNIQSALEAETNILAELSKAVKQAADAGLPAPTLNGVITSALSSLDWTLARAVDFNITPFVYLYPKSNNSSIVLPAVAPTDPSVVTTK